MVKLGLGSSLDSEQIKLSEDLAGVQLERSLSK
jgi:hypothetical protein